MGNSVRDDSIIKCIYPDFAMDDQTVDHIKTDFLPR